MEDPNSMANVKSCIDSVSCQFDAEYPLQQTRICFVICFVLSNGRGCGNKN